MFKSYKTSYFQKIVIHLSVKRIMQRIYDMCVIS